YVVPKSMPTAIYFSAGFLGIGGGARAGDDQCVGGAVKWPGDPGSSDMRRPARLWRMELYSYWSYAMAVVIKSRSGRDREAPMESNLYQQPISGQMLTLATVRRDGERRGKEGLRFSSFCRLTRPTHEAHRWADTRSGLDITAGRRRGRER